MQTLTMVGSWATVPDMTFSSSSGRTIPWSQVQMQATEVGVVPAVTCPSDSSMLTGDGPEVGDSCGLWGQRESWTSLQSQVGGGRTRDPVVVPGSSMGPGDTPVTGLSAGHPDHHDPSDCTFLSSHHGHRWWLRTCASLCPLVTSWAINIIDSDCRRATDPDESSEAA